MFKKNSDINIIEFKKDNYESVYDAIHDNVHNDMFIRTVSYTTASNAIATQDIVVVRNIEYIIASYSHFNAKYQHIRLTPLSKNSRLVTMRL